MAIEPSIPQAAARAAAERAAAVLARDPRVRLVYLFGSAADPTRTTARDADLAILTDPRLTLDELLRLRADVVGTVGAPIDLISLNDAPIVLAHEVVDSGVCLYAEPPEIETDFVVRARARYWDWMPFRDEQWKLAGERLAERRRGA
jgi:predicted nucleotidyltransferase